MLLLVIKEERRNTRFCVLAEWQTDGVRSMNALIFSKMFKWWWWRFSEESKLLNMHLVSSEKFKYCWKHIFGRRKKISQSSFNTFWWTLVSHGKQIAFTNRCSQVSSLTFHTRMYWTHCPKHCIRCIHFLYIVVSFANSLYFLSPETSREKKKNKLVFSCQHKEEGSIFVCSWDLFSIQIKHFFQ